MRIRIEKEHGSDLKTLHDEEMTVSTALDLAENAVKSLAVDDYFSVIRVIPRAWSDVFSFSRTEGGFLLCYNGRPHAVGKLQPNRN